jgi:MOSC domain-containing protein
LRVSSLSIFPVKSCAGRQVSEAQVEARGLATDRRWMIVDEKWRHFTQRESGGLARIQCDVMGSGIRFVDGPEVRAEEAVTPVGVSIWGHQVQAGLAPDRVSDWLSSRIGTSVRLVRMPADSIRPVDPKYGRAGDEVSFADGFPILLASVTSLDVLNAQLPKPVSMSRFRPNIVIAGAEPFAEDRWQTVQIGEIEFELVKSCARCVVVDTDPESGHRSKGVLRQLATFRRSDGQVHFGQNTIPTGTGVIRTGDPVTVLSEGQARPAL